MRSGNDASVNYRTYIIDLDRDVVKSAEYSGHFTTTPSFSVIGATGQFASQKMSDADHNLR